MLSIIQLVLLLITFGLAVVVSNLNQKNIKLDTYSIEESSRTLYVKILGAIVPLTFLSSVTVGFINNGSIILFIMGLLCAVASTVYTYGTIIIGTVKDYDRIKVIKLRTFGNYSLSCAIILLVIHLISSAS